MNNLLKELNKLSDDELLDIFWSSTSKYERAYLAISIHKERQKLKEQSK